MRVHRGFSFRLPSLRLQPAPRPLPLHACHPVGPSATSTPQIETPSNVTHKQVRLPLRRGFCGSGCHQSSTQTLGPRRQIFSGKGSTDFEAEHPGLELEVRIKADEGELGLVNALSVTSMAAPSALPDLIALSRPALETAALKGLLHPIDGLSTALDDPNWYEYARQLGHIQNTGYGLPFAGDALVLVYHSEVERINSWNDILASENPLVFAGRPKSIGGFGFICFCRWRTIGRTGTAQPRSGCFDTRLNLDCRWHTCWSFLSIFGQHGFKRAGLAGIPWESCKYGNYLGLELPCSRRSIHPAAPGP